MPPKPGFWYYDSVRAGRVYLFLLVLGAGVIIPKLDLPTEEELVAAIELYQNFFLFLLPQVVLLAVLFWCCRIQRRRLRSDDLEEDSGFGGRYYRRRISSEPDPDDYEDRMTFVEALRKFGQSKGYKPGWAYYRSNELWPEH